MKTLNSIFLTIIWFAISLTSCDNASASKEFKKNIDGLTIYTLDQIKGIPGLSIAVIKGDQIVHMGSYGFADVGNNVKATNTTPYYIASTTKSFNGTLAQILHNENVLDLDI